MDESKLLSNKNCLRLALKENAMELKIKIIIIMIVKKNP